MNKLIYKNESGGTLEFGGSPPFLITTIDGLGAVNNEISTSKSPYQDGVSINNKSLTERHLTLEGVIITRNREERQRSRRRLIQLFNPKADGKLTIYQDGEIRRIDCIPELAPSFPSAKQENYQPFLINLFCPNPFLQDTEESKTDISTEVGNFEFPLELVEEGIELSIRTISFITNLYNPGDVETPIRVRLKATGTVENPIIENLDTGEFIRIKRTLAEGETLEINTAFGNKRVEVIKPNGNRENVFHYIDYKSTFFSLSDGDNTIKYDAEVGENNLDVSIYYTPNYLGI